MHVTIYENLGSSVSSSNLSITLRMSSIYLTARTSDNEIWSGCVIKQRVYIVAPLGVGVWGSFPACTETIDLRT